MKKNILIILATILLASTFAFAGSKTRDQWLAGLPVNNYLYLSKLSYLYYDSTNYKVAVSSDMKVTGGVTTSGKNITTPLANAALSTTGTITITSSFMTVASTGNAVINAATCLISTATAVNPNGTKLILIGTSDTDTITLTDNAVLALGAATRLLGIGDILELIISNGVWYEVGFTNN